MMEPNINLGPFVHDVDPIHARLWAVARVDGFRSGQEAMRKRAGDAAEAHGRIVSNEPVGKACARNIARSIAALPVEEML